MREGIEKGLFGLWPGMGGSRMRLPAYVSGRPQSITLLRRGMAMGWRSALKIPDTEGQSAAKATQRNLARDM